MLQVLLYALFLCSVCAQNNIVLNVVNRDYHSYTGYPVPYETTKTPNIFQCGRTANNSCTYNSGTGIKVPSISIADITYWGIVSFFLQS